MSLDERVRKALAEIESLSMTTMARTVSGKVTMHSRIISICGSDTHRYFLEDNACYPAIRFFCIHKGKGEYFDFELKNCDHKLLRTRFAFGGNAFNDAGASA